jgi:hypothetical protein
VAEPPSRRADGVPPTASSRWSGSTGGVSLCSGLAARTVLQCAPGSASTRGILSACPVPCWRVHAAEVAHHAAAALRLPECPAPRARTSSPAHSQPRNAGDVVHMARPGYSGRDAVHHKPEIVRRRGEVFRAHEQQRPSVKPSARRHRQVTQPRSVAGDHYTRAVGTLSRLQQGVHLHGWVPNVTATTRYSATAWPPSASPAGSVTRLWLAVGGARSSSRAMRADSASLSRRLSRMRQADCPMTFAPVHSGGESSHPEEASSMDRRSRRCRIWIAAVSSPG